MGREGCCRQTSLACVGSTRSVPPTLGLPPLMACVCFPCLHCSGFRLLSRERALSCIHFPGLSRSGSGSGILHKDANSVGPAFCAVPGTVRAAQAARSLTSALFSGAARLLPSVPASVSPRAPSGEPCVSSGELDSSCDPPCRCRPSRISGSLWLETGSVFAVW